MGEQAPPPESVPPLTGMPPTARETNPPTLCKYKLMTVWMRPGQPLTFSDGERIVSVVATEQEPRSADWRLTVLVKLP